MTPLDYACEAVAKGLRPFPVKRATKDEHVSTSWPPMCASVPTDKMLELWFGDVPRNVAIGTKASRLLVIDEDAPGELAKVEAEYGETFAATYTVLTSKGRQLYYRDDEGTLGNRQKYQGREIDIRGGGEGDGGYVIGAGSIHPDGTFYEAIDSGADIAPLQPWVRAWLSEGGRDEPKSDAPQRDPNRERRFTPTQAREYVERYGVAWLRDAKPGGRNGALNTAAVVVGHFVPTLFTEREARKRLREMAEDVELSGAEIGKTISSGLRKGMSEPYAIIAEETVAPVEAVAQLGPAHLLPAEFWDGAVVLKHIRDAALSQLVSPDAVLHATLALLASTVDKETHVHTGVRPSKLSYFAALIGGSGGGKTQALEVARELVADYLDKRFIPREGEDEKEPYLDIAIGSGEGLIDMFCGDKREETPAPTAKDPDKVRVSTKWGQVRHNAMASKDEGRELLSVNQRHGATGLSILCELWSGSKAGQFNTASGGKRRSVEKGSYTLGVVLGFQPEKIEPLFDDAAGGTPQRFAYAMAEYAPLDPDQGMELPPWPGELRINMRAESAGVKVKLDADAAAEVQHHRRLKAAGKLPEDGAGELDGHRMLLRCRVAALLTLLCEDTVERDEITVSPTAWDLSKQIVDTSCGLRNRLAGLGAARRARAERREDERQVGVQVSASVHLRLTKAAESIVDMIAEHENREMSLGRAKNGRRSYRDVADAAIEVALGDGRLEWAVEGRILRAVSDAE